MRRKWRMHEDESKNNNGGSKEKCSGCWCPRREKEESAKYFTLLRSWYVATFFRVTRRVLLEEGWVYSGERLMTHESSSNTVGWPFLGTKWQERGCFCGVDGRLRRRQHDTGILTCPFKNMGWIVSTAVGRTNVWCMLAFVRNLKSVYPRRIRSSWYSLWKTVANWFCCVPDIPSFCVQHFNHDVATRCFMYYDSFPQNSLRVGKWPTACTRVSESCLGRILSELSDLSVLWLSSLSPDECRKFNFKWAAVMCYRCRSSPARDV